MTWRICRRWPDRFAESWKLMHSIPLRFPHLAAVQPHVADVLCSLAPAAE
jgi:hypothetical protein